LAGRLTDRQQFFTHTKTAADSTCHTYFMGRLFGDGPSVPRPNSEFSQTTGIELELAQSTAAADPAGESPVRSGMARHPVLAALLFGAVALALFLAGIGKPNTTFYDEGYYIPAAKTFLTGAPYTNPEAPPLGKELMAIGIKVAGDNPFGWRVAGAVCGALTLTAIFLWTYLLTRDFEVACLAATLTLFDNFLFVMSRVAMMDAFLLFFLSWGLLAYTAALELELRPLSRRVLLCCAGALVGLAGACKWNAVDTLAVLLVVSFALYGMARRPGTKASLSLARYSRHVRQIGMPSVTLGLIVLPVLSYSLTYWPLCRSLRLPFGIHQLVAMNQFIWRFHVAVVVNEPITSAWYTWPLHALPQRGLSYLLGNPVVMWSGLAAILFCLWRFWKSFAVTEGLLVLLYAANLLQWAVTPAKGTFYYYYYPAAMILGVAIAVSLRSLPSRIFGVRVSLILLVATGAVFLWCFPRMAHLQPPWDCALGCWS
jgi:dolichyl-phosphate-mannose-protein mannosyltransferase